MIEAAPGSPGDFGPLFHVVSYVLFLLAVMFGLRALNAMAHRIELHELRVEELRGQIAALGRTTVSTAYLNEVLTGLVEGGSWRGQPMAGPTAPPASGEGADVGDRPPG